MKSGVVRKLEGPPSYDNWRAAENGVASRGGFEFPIFSDAWLTGSVRRALGPYRLYASSSFGRNRHDVKQVAVLRYELHIDYPDSDFQKTSVGHYHAGEPSDEIIALASLLSGVRLAAGGQNRIFDPDGDPRGYPEAHYRPVPVLDVPPYAKVLPHAGGDHDIGCIDDLTEYPRLSGRAAIALVRAARAYQRALWIAESDASLAWLLMVSAVESVANFWSKTDEGPVERLHAMKPEFAQKLEDIAGRDGIALVAAEFAHTLGAMKKFRDFLLKFMPSPPAVRPAGWGQVDWSADGLGRAIRLIYKYRSEALHDSVPFPGPMCDAPYKHESWRVVGEKPTGRARSHLGGTWLAKDLPMHLHIFDYISRRAIVAWWKSSAA